MTIQQQCCPRCAIKRTLWRGERGSFWWNCRLQWGSRSDGARQPTPTSAAAPWRPDHFGPAELVRLAIYRAAVRTGFYSDWRAADTTPARFTPSAAKRWANTHVDTVPSGPGLRSRSQITACMIELGHVWLQP